MAKEKDTRARADRAPPLRLVSLMHRSTLYATALVVALCACQTLGAQSIDPPTAASTSRDAPPNAQSPEPEPPKSTSPALLRWHCAKLCESQRRTPREPPRVFLPSLSVEEDKPDGSRTFFVLTQCEAPKAFNVDLDCASRQIETASGCDCSKLDAPTPTEDGKADVRGAVEEIELVSDVEDVAPRSQWQLVLSFPSSTPGVAWGEPVYRATFDAQADCVSKRTEITNALTGGGRFFVACRPPTSAFVSAEQEAIK